MTDRIAYLVTDHGVDGRDKEHIVFASFDEQEANDWYNGNPNKAYYSQTKRIIEVEKETKQAMAKLNGVHRMLLGIEQRPNKKVK